MKKIFLLLIILISGLLSVQAGDTYTRDINILPSMAKTTIKNYMKGEISHIKIEKKRGSISEYDVILTDGSEISFDKNGNWKDIEMNRNASVPQQLIPQPIQSYVKDNHKGALIIGIEKKKSGYDVELSNGVEIEFNNSGKFIRYDR